jgi:hypothetical protein
MDPNNFFENFYNYVIDKIITDRHILLPEITQDMILSTVFQTLQREFVVSDFFERIKRRIAANHLESSQTETQQTSSSSNKDVNEECHTESAEKEPIEVQTAREVSSVISTSERSFPLPEKKIVLSDSFPGWDGSTEIQPILGRKRTRSETKEAPLPPETIPRPVPVSASPLVSFKYQKKNTFYLGLGEIIIENKNTTIIKRFVLTDPSNIPESTVQESKELIQVKTKDVYRHRTKLTAVPYYYIPGKMHYSTCS